MKLLISALYPLLRGVSCGILHALVAACEQMEIFMSDERKDDDLGKIVKKAAVGTAVAIGVWAILTPILGPIGIAIGAAIGGAAGGGDGDGIGS